MILNKKYLFVCLYAALVLGCKNEPPAPKPIPKPSTPEWRVQAELPEIKAITAIGTIQLADGSTQPIPHHGEQGYLTLFLVKHAEQDGPNTGNPLLTAEGRAHAERLGRTFDNAVVDKLAFVNTKRCQETAQVVRGWAGDPVLENFPEMAQLDWLSENIDLGSGKRIVFIGHGSSIPALLNHLTASIRYRNLPENDYNRFFVAVSQGVGKTEVYEYRY